ncbi:hypothetical protein TorRG33x02_204180 [Trema orientale]|uniref:Uncharacterized protein n=1 Tax=Trema orientale TaxID=63057 RepID=A0A2P5EE00_TREOI|nr:hypothetical protein TorRG33x02_204180 [Trema orientale]
MLLRTFRKIPPRCGTRRSSKEEAEVEEEARRVEIGRTHGRHDETGPSKAAGIVSETRRREVGTKARRLVGRYRYVTNAVECGSNASYTNISADAA